MFNLHYFAFVFIRWTAEEHFLMDGGIEAKGIIVSSDVQIAVLLGFIDVFYDPQIFTDATPIQPVSSSQTTFHVLNHVNQTHRCIGVVNNHFFGISASEDDTEVTVTSPDGSESFTLNLHETYSEIAYRTSPEIELLGYHIESSAPVTVLSGNLCTFNNNEGPEIADGTYISTQRPVNEYSTEYIVPNIQAPRNSGYDVHVVAGEDGTSVDIDGRIYEIDEGEVINERFPGRVEPTRVTCSLPCNVVQFTRGEKDSDGMFMISVVPTVEFSTTAFFTASYRDFGTAVYITVIVGSPTPVSDLLLDGISFSPEWLAYRDVTYAIAFVTDGAHVMTSTESQFALYTYAHSGFYAGGYGYVAPPRTGIDF